MYLLYEGEVHEGRSVRPSAPDPAFIKARLEGDFPVGPRAYVSLSRPGTFPGPGAIPKDRCTVPESGSVARPRWTVTAKGSIPQPWSHSGWYPEVALWFAVAFQQQIWGLQDIPAISSIRGVPRGA